MARKIVVGIKNSSVFSVKEGRECEVLKEEFYNGEGHYYLEDIHTGERFQSPDIFWKEK